MFRVRQKKLASALVAAAALAAAAVPSSASALPASAKVPFGEVDCVPAVFSNGLSSDTCGSELVGGRAVAPSDAPPQVKDVIAAANRIDHRRYLWGGGHLGFQSSGYDCSGAVSYALHGGGLLGFPMVSGQLADWGEGGPGRWITVYANAEHVYMIVAGLRYDTRDDLPGVSGPRWHPELVHSPKFVVRHPAGL